MSRRGIGYVDPACPLNRDHPTTRCVVGEWAVVPNSGWSTGFVLRDLVRGLRSPNDGTIGSATTRGGNADRWRYGYMNFAFNASANLNFGSPTSLTDLKNTGMTAAALVRVNSSGQEEYIFAKENPSLPSGGWMFHLDTANVVIFDVTNSALNNRARFTLPDSNGTWVWLGATWDGQVNSATGINLYRNGVVQTVTRTNGTGTNASDAGTNLRTATDTGGTAKSDMAVAWLFLANAVYTDGEMGELYRQVATGNPDRWNWLGKRTWFASTQAAASASIAHLTTNLGQLVF